MSLIYKFEKARDLLDKSLRELKRLDAALVNGNDEAIADATFNFVITTFHIKDWLICDSTLSLSKNEVESYVKNSKHLSICRDLCNSGKHFLIDRYPLVTDNMNLSVGPSAVLMGPGGTEVHIPNRKVKIRTKNGDSYELMEFAIHCFQEWDKFFNERNLKGIA